MLLGTLYCNNGQAYAWHVQQFHSAQSNQEELEDAVHGTEIGSYAATIVSGHLVQGLGDLPQGGHSYRVQ